MTSNGDRPKPYVRKLRRVAWFNIWLVDGKYIRNNIDEEFSNFGQHYRFKFIPESEFWIDSKHTRKELRFYIHHLLIENSLMADGLSYDKAEQIADASEKRERKKVDFLNQNIHLIPHEEKVRKVHKRLLRTYSKYIKIWIVYGHMVRDLFYIDFTEGGHHFVYPWVPEDELWIDSDIRQTERKFIMTHELHERYLMMTKGKTYEKAHELSSALEHECRRRRKNVDAELEKAIEENQE